MSRDLQNICSRTKKKTRVEILKFESKKMRVELKKKYSSRERENADQLCCLSMSSLHRYEASIQSSGLLATKYCRFFLLPWQTYRGLRKAAQFSFIKMTVQNSYFGALTSTKGHLQLCRQDIVRLTVVQKQGSSPFLR